MTEKGHGGKGSLRRARCPYGGGLDAADRKRKKSKDYYCFNAVAVLHLVFLQNNEDAVVQCM